MNTRSIPPQVVSLDDYEALARERLDAQALAYITGGVADEHSLRDNRSAFQQLRLKPRVLNGVRHVDTRLNLLGCELDYPVLLAPVAYHRLAHPDGELATALGAGALRAALVLSCQASVALEAVAQQAQAPLWFQLYLQADRKATETLVHRAEAAGYRALVITVDAPVTGPRNREQHAGFRLPEGVEAVNLRDLPPAATNSLDDLLQRAPTWADIAWLRLMTRLPILLKGVLNPDDAERATEYGVDGLIVSNHGGRVLDTVPATIDALPRIAERLNGSLPLLLDGGIRRGTDVLKALALGADAVLIGRPAIYGLAVGGASGVAHVLRILHTELQTAMALTGCARLSDINPDCLWRDEPTG